MMPAAQLQWVCILFPRVRCTDWLACLKPKEGMAPKKQDPNGSAAVGLGLGPGAIAMQSGTLGGASR